MLTSNLRNRIPSFRCLNTSNLHQLRPTSKKRVLRVLPKCPATKLVPYATHTVYYIRLIMDLVRKESMCKKEHTQNMEISRTPITSNFYFRWKTSTVFAFNITKWIHTLKIKYFNNYVQWKNEKWRLRHAKRISTTIGSTYTHTHAVYFVACERKKSNKHNMHCFHFVCVTKSLQRFCGFLCALFIILGAQLDDWTKKCLHFSLKTFKNTLFKCVGWLELTCVKFFVNTFSFETEIVKCNQTKKSKFDEIFFNRLKH